MSWLSLGSSRPTASAASKNRTKGPLHNYIYKTEDFHQPTGRSPLNRGGKSV